MATKAATKAKRTADRKTKTQSSARSRAKAEGPSAIELLEQDHREVEELFAQYNEASDDEKTELVYRSIADVLEPKLYPTPQAIANVYEEGVRQDKDAAKVNPMELWDLHFLRELDDAGFLEQLWATPAR